MPYRLCLSSRPDPSLRTRSEFFSSSPVVECPAVYRDEHGSGFTTLYNDGETLRMTIRGVEFAGDEFDSLEPMGDQGRQELAQFTMEPVAIAGSGDSSGTTRHSLFLRGFTLECEFPIVVVAGPNTTSGHLVIRVDLREGDNKETREQAPSLQLELRHESGNIKSSGRDGFFDGELYDIQKVLPQGVYLKACTNCAFSASHPVGRGSFVGLACFRSAKQEFRAAADKYDVMRLWHKRTAFVQDTYLCPEFEPQDWLLRR